MATSKAVRADDVSGLNIATASFTEDAVTKDVQRVILNNSTDGTMATVGAAGLKVDPSGATSPVSIAATVNVRQSDGTNPVTKTFDLDSGAGTEYNLGVGLRKAASGGSVEAGTSSDPLRIDPTGTTVQPVSASSLPLPTGAATLAKQPALGTAGTPSADVITIQGAASMTAVKTDGSGVTQPVSGTVTANAGSNLNTSALALDATLTGGTQKSKLVDTGGTNVASVSAAGALKVDGSAVTQPVSGTVTATLSGSISNTGFNVTPATSGGTSAYHAVAAASNNAASIKGSAGQVFGWSIYNNAAYPIYVKLYNKATSPAPATDNALLIRVVGVQAGTHVPYFNATGIAGFANGIGIAVVKGITDTDNTSLLLSDCLIEIDYK